MDLLVVRVEDLQLLAEQGHVVEVVLGVLGLLEFLELHEGGGLLPNEDDHHHVPAIR